MVMLVKEVKLVILVIQVKLVVVVIHVKGGNAGNTGIAGNTGNAGKNSNYSGSVDKDGKDIDVKFNAAKRVKPMK